MSATLAIQTRYYKDPRLHYLPHASTTTPTITDVSNKLETTIFINLKFPIAKLQDSQSPHLKVKLYFSWYFLAQLCCQKQDFLFIVVKWRQQQCQSCIDGLKTHINWVLVITKLVVLTRLTLYCALRHSRVRFLFASCSQQNTKKICGVHILETLGSWVWRFSQPQRYWIRE